MSHHSNNQAATQADQCYIYTKKDGYIPRVAAVHDLCGYGKCSLGIVIPVLSAAGIDVCPLPTALFSAHTKYPVFTFRDTTEDLPGYIDAWQKIGVDLDAIYSGFLGSGAQIDTILELARRYPQARLIIDPVMGDGGQLYPTYTDDLCQAMRQLAWHAEVLTPNLTEAAILTGQAYAGQAPSDEAVQALLTALLDRGVKYVVLKGIERGEEVVNFVAGQDIKTEQISGPLYPEKLHGTGDLFASVLTAALISGHSLAAAVRTATDLVYQAMFVSARQPDYAMRGVSFESLLGQVAKLA
ncbi:MAG: pyridoxamine kinase [Oscillospiraceae bacterium]|nr:pyridoxamine kinase [Oscillospiraceae bacterium]